MTGGYGMGGLGGSYGGVSTAGGYTIGFVTGTIGGYERVEALENTLRGCLGVQPLPGTAQPLPGTAPPRPPSAS